ncbi:MAG: (Fe-S)-binding protein [Bacteroidota bacterium]|jgi:heterodisulfide reductase subunit C|nr:(Fe-S)-binding protein [Bacteroidota bacterium]
MHIILQIVFIVLLAVGIYMFATKSMYIRKNILMGREEILTDQPKRRWANVLLLAFGQKKMFKNPLVAVMHFIIYAGFIIINIEVLEIILDGILGTHRLFAAPLGQFYNWLINIFECLAIGVIIVCIIFLIRRNVLHIRRFISKDLNGWPRSDANYILITEIILMSLFLTMNATDTLLQMRGYSHYAEHITGNFIFSGHLHTLFNSLSSKQLAFVERSAWWLHIAGIIAFLNYLPYSKHLHIILAFPNAYYASLEPKGKMHNMPEIQKEVLYAMQPELIPAEAAQAETAHKFGAKDVMDLSWKNLLDAYTCTECGRCTAACPANITGKLLSPRMIMMKTRDRIEEVGHNRKLFNKGETDGKSLLHDYITVEELRACTTCNACVEECPASISPLDIILQMRRYLIMEESNAPQEWNSTFSNIENNFAPWKFSPEERDQWTVDAH